MGEITFSGLSYDDPAEIERMARIHESGPLDWIPGYKVDEALVAERAKFLRQSQGNEAVCVLVARNAADEMVGFHWLQRVEKYGRPCARIDSLWVDEMYRRQGIAQALKERGEAWAKSVGAALVITEVFYVNKGMIDLNLKLGFEARQVEMIKRL
jgi:GNAT superfamily N-acetyltransferase